MPAGAGACVCDPAALADGTPGSAIPPRFSYPASTHGSAIPPRFSYPSALARFSYSASTGRMPGALAGGTHWFSHSAPLARFSHSAPLARRPRSYVFFGASELTAAGRTRKFRQPVRTGSAIPPHGSAIARGMCCQSIGNTSQTVQLPGRFSYCMPVQLSAAHRFSYPATPENKFRGVRFFC